MATITLTSSTNFDAGAALAANNGDTIQMQSGAVLTINSDMRWGQNACVPASLNCAQTTPGSLVIDGTTVWEIPFSSSSGNVPSLGTEGVQNCTGGTSGATGEFLGIFTALGVAPSTSGGAMPSSGIIKFRSKVGTFASTETITLPGAATIVSSSAGKRSWISIVVNAANSVLSFNSLGAGLSVTGDWY